MLHVIEWPCSHSHGQAGRQSGRAIETEREMEREMGRGLPTADTFVSTHVVGADINNSINCCTPKFCQRASFGALHEGCVCGVWSGVISVVIDLQAYTIRSYQSVVHLDLSHRAL